MATLVIAAFTIVLAFVTRAQASLTREAIDLARKEYVTAHRPRIILRDVYLIGETIHYMLVNMGDTKATVIESWIFAEFIEEGGRLVVPKSAGHNDLGQLVFAGGESKDLSHDLPPQISFAIKIPGTRRIGIEDKPVVFGSKYFVGVLVYIDDLGVKRRSVFRRQWVHSGLSFVRLAEDQERDQEYAH